MRWMFFWSCAALTPLALLCCEPGSETPSRVAAPADSGMPTNDVATVPSDAGADAEAPDAAKRSPTGCLLTPTEFLVGTEGKSITPKDAPTAAPWSNPSRALASDGQFAEIVLSDGQPSAILSVSGFGANVPAGAETWGIEVELKRQAPDGGLEDARVDVAIEGKTSNFKYMLSPWPTSIVGTHVYGQAVDTWGVDLNPDDVNRASFAATVTVKRSATAPAGVPVTGWIDSLKVRIWFCPNPKER